MHIRSALGLLPLLLLASLAHSIAVPDLPLPALPALPLPLPDVRLLSLEACYGDLGCFNNRGKFFHPIHRPILLLPQSPERIGTRFQLYTRRNPKSPVSLEHHDAGTVKRSNFNGRLPTILVIHGFLGWDDLPWMNGIREALLDKYDCNVIQIGWAGGSITAYMQAASNTRVVGAVIARMLLWLEREHRLNRGLLHIIGFSLGAQVAGFAGERMRLNGRPVARITGLDPAGPYFEGTDPVARLDPTDAHFVDVVHTDAGHWHVGLPLANGGLGTDSSVGHVDFFVNGGHHQPGCLSITACDHSRAPELFMQTIRNSDKAAFAAYPCGSYNKFLSGACDPTCPSGGCVAMGYHAYLHKSRFVSKRATGAQPHYLLTGAGKPYALVHYHVSIRLSAASPYGHIGELHLRLRHPAKTGGKCWPQGQLPRIRRLEPSSLHRVVFACDWPAGSGASELRIGWTDRSLLTWLLVKRSIAVDSVTLTEMGSGSARRYCQFNSIVTGSHVEGKPC